MLGIRKFMGTAIDLWQGDIACFVCDAVTVIPKNADDAACGAVLSEGMASAEESGLRHVAVVIATPVMARATMALTRRFLEQRGLAGSVRRITFVLADSAGYEAFQGEMFREFPEG